MNIDDVVADALAALAGERLTRQAAVAHVPRRPGLYAIYGGSDAWRELQLDGDASTPLYVGKAERSLNGRDVGTHFASGKTGSSTVRRSLAALLVDELELRAVPRNRTNPDGSANFAVDELGDERLSRWMDQRLRLTTWTDTARFPLGDVETSVVRHWKPPLNLDKVGEPRVRLRAARRAMATTARSWQS